MNRGGVGGGYPVGRDKNMASNSPFPALSVNEAKMQGDENCMRASRNKYHCLY